MGNKLCAPLMKKNYRDEHHPWAPKKDSHLLRLWAEIFEVRVEADEICWARVSDDVVPVNITCIQDSPETVFQITAYNRHVEKIFDVRLIQPGTKITQASECFVHWKDSRHDNEWGLNFTTPVDARRFRDCCMLVLMPNLWRKGSFASLRDSIRKSPAAHNKLARKATSSGSLRLSPPKRVRGNKKTPSNPTSPIAKPRRAISTPEELALNQDAIEQGFIYLQEAHTPTSMDSQSAQSGYSGIEGIATMPRSQRQRQAVADVRQIYDHQGGGTLPHRGHGHHQRPVSAASNPVYDHLPARRNVRYDSMGNAMPLPDVPNNQRHHQHQQQQLQHENPYQSRAHAQAEREALYQTRKQAQREALYQTRNQVQSDREALYQTRSQTQAEREALYQTREQARLEREALYQTRSQVQQQQERDREAIYQTRMQAQREREALYQTRNQVQQDRETLYQTRNQMQRDREVLYQTRNQVQRDKQLYQSKSTVELDRPDGTLYQTRSTVQLDRQDSLYSSRSQAQALYQSKSQAALDRQPNIKSILYGSQEKMLDDREQFFDDNANEQLAERRLSKPELRQFSREPTCIRLSQLDNDDHYRQYHINETRDMEQQHRDHHHGQDDVDHSVQIQVKEATPTPRCKTPKTPLSPPRRSRSSSSPEWPPPPDPLGPTSPETPVTNSGFDSNTLKRMLRSLPESSPENEDNDMDQGYQEGGGYQPQQQQQQRARSTSSSPTHRQQARYQETHINHTPTSPVKKPSSSAHHLNHSHSGPQPSHHHHHIDLAHLPPHAVKSLDRDSLMMGHPRPASAAATHAAHADQIKHFSVDYPGDQPASRRQGGSTVVVGGPDSGSSYPDSGVSGMTDDRAGSVKSGDSGRSAKSSKTSTLPSGVGLGHGSKSGSSGGSSSGRRSDIIRHLGTDSETTEVRQVTSSDISDSESETSSEGHTSDSSIHTMPSESQASFASKSAAIRKAGWLTVKNWLMHKKRKLEQAPKKTWKKYWVCLKGTMLLFYNCDEGESIREDSIPRHMLVIEGGIAQSVPEHPKRENIFSLSTAFGDAYLFQATSQIEQENWINALHSACASSFARQHGKENTIKLLRSEIHKLENSIDIDIKMKKMADLQLTVVSDPRSKAAIEKQIAQWDENLEKLYMEQYRLRCYMASLQGCELPNPKNLLAYVSKGTKSALSRIGVFTVTSFHALVCARTPLITSNIYNKNKKKGGLLSTFKADSVTRIRPRSPKPFSPQSSTNQVYKTFDVGDQYVMDLSSHTAGATDDGDGGGEKQQGPPRDISFGENMVRIALPNGQSVMVGISEKMSVQEVLEGTCNKRQLNPNDHFMRFKMPGVDNFKIPEKTSFMENEAEFETIEVCPKIMFQMEMVKSDRDNDFGIAVEAELAEDTEQEDELCVFISEVVKGGLGHRRGLIVGDEILVINGKVVSELDMVFVETMLAESDFVCMTVRSCRVERPQNTTALMEHADVYIENMTCPPPPSQARISDKTIGELIVPAPNWVQLESKSDDEDQKPQKDVSDMSSEQIDNLLQGAEQVTHFCRLLHQPTPDNSATEEPVPVKPLSDSQKLRKVIMELIDTERHYVKDLTCLIERYLEPLKEETFLSGEDIEQLFGNIQEIVAFQKMFLQSLEEAIELEPNFTTLAEPKDFRRILFSLGGSFLYYANHFKLYSSFCASHSKAQKVLNPGSEASAVTEKNQALREFLRARNPKQQHSATLESYLIKPIQRILKYPLLLQQLKSLTHPHTDEHHHLAEALRGMEAVAEHINEMQKIYEEYGAIFEELIKAHRDAHPHGKSLDLNVGELQMYGTVTWLNAQDELGKLKKGTELVCTLFVFKAGVVILAQEKAKGKKKPKQPLLRPQPPSLEPGDVPKYQTVIPVDQLQVRASNTSDTQLHGLWELVHCKSETEGRPEKVFQLASSVNAKNDFIKTIRNIIRESVRRMTLPNPKATGKPRPPMLGQMYHYGSQKGRSADKDSTPLSQTAWSVGKKKGKQLKGDLVRHSMELEDKFNVLDQSGGGGGVGGGDFRTRSRTFSDLNNIDPNDTGEHRESASYPSGSQSTIASGSGSSSAKLLHSSNNPVNYSSSTNIHKDALGSPIWKPRHQAGPARPKPGAHVKSPLSNEGERTLESSVYTGSVYGDYSQVVYDQSQGQPVLLPNTYVEHEDTEC